VIFLEMSHSFLMMEAARTSETSIDNYFTRQYIPEDNSELNVGGLYSYNINIPEQSVQVAQRCDNN
jgi:hypothetical protein